MTKYITWKFLIEKIKTNLQLQYIDNVGHPHYAMSFEGKLPYSISETEFNYMKYVIGKHQLKRGFEFATGTGISTLGLGMGFQKSGGLLLSIDSYIEFETQSFIDNEQPTIYNSECFQNNKKIIDLFGLQDNVKLFSGWSPTDAVRIIDENFQDLDFVFLDGPKHKASFDETFKYIAPRLNKDKYIVFVHDTHVDTLGFIQVTEQYFNLKPQFLTNLVYDEYNTTQQYPIALITNIII
jgi:hypothetical protein